MKDLKKALNDARTELHQFYNGGEEELLDHMDTALDGIEDAIAELDQHIIVALKRPDAEWLYERVGRLAAAEVSKDAYDALRIGLEGGPA